MVISKGNFYFPGIVAIHCTLPNYYYDIGGIQV
jgi:hypothetical protein